jgi:hypothetical protein
VKKPWTKRLWLEFRIAQGQTLFDLRRSQVSMMLSAATITVKQGREN